MMFTATDVFLVILAIVISIAIVFTIGSAISFGFSSIVKYIKNLK